LTSIKIPPDQLQALRTLIGISDDQMDALLRILSEVPLSLDLEGFVNEVAPKLAFVSQSEKVIQALVALNVTRAHSEPPVSDLVNDVLDALEEGKAGSLGDRRASAQKRLTQLLTITRLAITTKAIHLQIDHERLLASVRILTEARPVFGTNVNAPPDAVLITHTLKLSYYQDGKPIDFYVALDSDDILKLKEALERAQTKAVSLSKIFEAATIPVVRT
jgi:hypothetical protein